MGRHHDKKYGLTPYAVGGRREHRHRQKRQMKRTLALQANYPTVTRPGMIRPMGLGLIGLLGVGILGLSLLKRRSIGGVSTFGKTSSFGFGRMSALRSWLPFKNRGIITPGVASIAPIASTGIASSGVVGLKGVPVTSGISTGLTSGLSTGIANAPIVHNRKVPLRERALSKITRRPVVTNYH